MKAAIGSPAWSLALNLEVVHSVELRPLALGVLALLDKSSIQNHRVAAAGQAMREAMTRAAEASQRALLDAAADAADVFLAARGLALAALALLEGERDETDESACAICLIDMYEKTLEDLSERANEVAALPHEKAPA